MGWIRNKKGRIQISFLKEFGFVSSLVHLLPIQFLYIKKSSWIVDMLYCRISLCVKLSLYSIFKKSFPFLYSDSLFSKGKCFLDIQYLFGLYFWLSLFPVIIIQFLRIVSLSLLYTGWCLKSWRSCLAWSKNGDTPLLSSETLVGLPLKPILT